MSIRDARDRMRDRLGERLPQQGAMGTLFQRRPLLYWLLLVVGGLAYVAVLAAAVFGFALVFMSAVQALSTAAAGHVGAAAAWGALAMATLGALGTLVYVSARIAAQYGAGED